MACGHRYGTRRGRVRPLEETKITVHRSQIVSRVNGVLIGLLSLLKSVVLLAA
jgi:hypothetical protein